MTPIDPASWPPLLAVAVLALAVHRVTRLLVADKVTEKLRKRIALKRVPSVIPDGYHVELRPWVGYLVTCPWCVGVYVASAAVLAAALLPWPWVAWPALAAACSSVTGLLAGHESSDG